jgi:hypothetical protein
MGVQNSDVCMVCTKGRKKQDEEIEGHAVNSA